ncbi:MAG: hypothetical protein EA370_11990 [Wenzhouxiangella sp.]|nr:MAG: hypothetical protein EA370_11990 [Wenzhouxiangella sp.]
MRNTILSAILVGGLPLSVLAAGGHYPVDDADITAPGDFQIETWFTRVDGDNSEFAFLPAWTPRGTTLELTAGFYRLDEDGDSFNRFEPAAKWQFSGLEPGRLAVAASVALGFDDGDFTDWLVNLPVSYELSNAPIVLHGNVGWIRLREDEDIDRAFVGAAFEWGATEAFDLIGQVYREGADEDPEAQLGLRFGFGGPLDHIDFAAGRTLRGDKDWFFTVGLGLTF